MLFRGKWLQYVEQSILLAVVRAGGLPVMLPGHDAQASELLEDCDGLLLTGGSDVAPESYGERARRPEWCGDAQRDRYELELLGRARALELPVLGVCRGCQLLAVGSGGRLHQDIAAERPDALQHRCQERYDRLMHDAELVAGSRLATLHGGRTLVHVNSVHHQAIREPGQLRVVARAPDGIVEAVESPGPRFEIGVQWHPEWLPAEHEDPFFPGFVAACAGASAQRV